MWTYHLGVDYAGWSRVKECKHRARRRRRPLLCMPSKASIDALASVWVGLNGRIFGCFADNMLRPIFTFTESGDIVILRRGTS